MKKIKLITIVLYSLILITSCTNQTNVPSRITNVINKYYDGFISNDSNMIASVYSKNYESIGYPNKEDKRNSTSEIGFIKMVHSWHSDFIIKGKNVSAYPSNDGYKVYVTGVEHFKHNDTDALIDLRFLDVWSINKSGEIIYRDRFQDNLDYWRDIDYDIAKKVEVTFEVDMSNTKVEKGLGDEPAV